MTIGSLARALAATPIFEVDVTKEIILDWRDGPFEGFLSVANPLSHWHFRIVAGYERPDDVDDRLFALSPMTDTLMSQALRAVSANVDKVIEVPHPSVIDAVSLDEVLGRIGRPEVLAVLVSPARVERMWLVEPDIAVRRVR